MSMKPENTGWQDQAKSLVFGQKRKVPHCAPDPSAYISNSPAGLRLHCFRCGENLFVKHGRLSASDVLAMRKRDEAEAELAYPDVVPMYVDGVHPDAILWILKAGITPERASDEYGFGWSDRSSRVIVPVLHNGDPAGVWTGRSVDGRKPKYLMPRGSVGASWFRLRGDRKACVVVEDILSAIRVSEAGYNSIAVLGTTVSSTQATLLADYPVVGWFDGDKAGRSGFVKLRKALGPYGITPKRVQTQRDPKTYNRNEIIKYIEDAT